MLSLDTWESMPPEASEFMKAMRIRENAFDFSVVQNASVEQLIPMLIKRKLSDHEMAAYRMPFPTRESREPLVPLWMDFPISGQPVVPHEIQATYLEKMQSSQIPKLLLTVDEPSVGTPHQVEWVRANVPNTKIISIGAARHFMQEDQPEAIGKAINDWMLANRL